MWMKRDLPGAKSPQFFSRELFQICSRSRPGVEGFSKRLVFPKISREKKWKEIEI
jgi:hypothetical protein